MSGGDGTDITSAGELFEELNELIGERPGPSAAFELSKVGGKESHQSASYTLGSFDDDILFHISKEEGEWAVDICTSHVTRRDSADPRSLPPLRDTRAREEWIRKHDLYGIEFKTRRELIETVLSIWDQDPLPRTSESPLP